MKTRLATQNNRPALARLPKRTRSAALSALLSLTIGTTQLAITQPAQPAQAVPTEQLSDTLRQATDAYDTAKQDEEQAIARLNDTQSQLDDLTARLPNTQAKAKQATRDAYVNTATDTVIDIITNTHSITQLNDKLAYYKTSITLNKQTLETLTNDINTLTILQAEQQSLLNDATQAREQAQSAREQAQSAYDDAQAKQNQEAKERKKTRSRTTIPTHPNPQPESMQSETTISLQDFKRKGVVYANGWKYTYYSEAVLPGGGLNIPGRHHEDGLVCDGDGHVVVASGTLPKGTLVPTPLGRTGIVLDSGCDQNVIDIYIAS